VKLPGLGKISFKKIRLNIGRKDVIFTKPQFILDEKMALYYGIKYGRPYNPASIKTVSGPVYYKLDINSLRR
jgi:hypothetical protein